MTPTPDLYIGLTRKEALALLKTVDMRQHGEVLDRIQTALWAGTRSAFPPDREREAMERLLGTVQSYIAPDGPLGSVEEATALIELGSAIRRTYERKCSKAKELV